MYNGTLASQATISGTIAELAETCASTRGAIRQSSWSAASSRFRNHLRWFDARPLFGKRVLVTRPRDQAAEMVDRLSIWAPRQSRRR